MKEIENNDVLMISSFGGGGHKAYARAYKQKHPGYNISEWSIEYINSNRVPGKDTDTVVGDWGSAVFNYLQRKGWFFIMSILIFLYPIIKFFSGGRIRNNTCRILEHCLKNGNLPAKIEIVQPTHVRSIIRGVQQFLKKHPELVNDPKFKGFDINLVSTDYLSAGSSIFLDSLKDMADFSANPNIRLSFMAPKSPFDDNLKLSESSSVTLKKIDESELVSSEFKEFDHIEPSKIRLSRLVFEDKGPAWERGNIHQASGVLKTKLGNIAGSVGVPSELFTHRTHLSDNEQQVSVSVGSQGSDAVLRKSVKWFKGQCSDSTKPKTMYFFAAKGFDSALSILSRRGELTQNTHIFNDSDNNPMKFSQGGIDKTAQSYRFGDNNQHQIVLIPWCPQKLLADLVIQSDVAILKPGGISTFQAVNMRIKAEKIRRVAASGVSDGNNRQLEDPSQNISPPMPEYKKVHIMDHDSGYGDEFSSAEESGAQGDMRILQEEEAAHHLAETLAGRALAEGVSEASSGIYRNDSSAEESGYEADEESGYETDTQIQNSNRNL